MKVALQIKRDGNDESTQMTPYYHMLSQIERLDMLKDAICELENLYETELDEFHRGAL